MNVPLWGIYDRLVELYGFTKKEAYGIMVSDYGMDWECYA